MENIRKINVNIQPFLYSSAIKPLKLEQTPRNIRLTVNCFSKTFVIENGNDPLTFFSLINFILASLLFEYSLSF